MIRSHEALEKHKIFKIIEPAYENLVRISLLSNEGTGESAQNSPDPSLLAYTKYGGRWRLRIKLRPLALLVPSA